jgi:rRNA processing protein Gar1
MDLRATRANRVFYTDEKRIRVENTVIDKSNNGVGFLYEIVDCVRMCFSSVSNRRSARTAFRPRKKSQLCSIGVGAV